MSPDTPRPGACRHLEADARPAHAAQLPGGQSTLDGVGDEGAQLTRPQHCLQQISQHIDTFRSTTLPRLVRLGLVVAPQ